MYKCIRIFFEYGHMHRGINCTNIILLPKATHATSVVQYRTISYASVLYKLIDRVIAKRLQEVICSIIDIGQLGFIPGRHIIDNVLLASEIIKGYSRKGLSHRCMVKVDIKKAYDSVEWVFLESMMVEVGVPSKMVGLIMACVSTVSYSILLNGSPLPPFQARRGLRQGDPMSPYLFSMVMEYLSRYLGSLRDHEGF